MFGNDSRTFLTKVLGEIWKIDSYICIQSISAP
jgi:hypothetical protein